MCGCNGETLDECGVCDNDEANDCEQDCLGVWGGDAQIDDCGVCNGGNLDKDCNGICFGDAYLDDCGVCDNIEDNNNISCTGCTTLGACNFDLTALLQCEDCCLFFDCAGECGGDAFIGNCSTCIGGQTGLQEVDFNFDLDNLCNDIDDCPYDAENDADQDGICGDVDECPYDAENDADQDDICGDVDDCPYDAENDADQDDICGDVDECPYDAENDADQDGICGDVDECPYDAENDADQDGYLW